MYNASKKFTSDGTWVAPAGVSEILLIPDNGVGVLVSVTPNTSYSVTASTSPGSFGSLYQFKANTSNQNLTIAWTE